MPKWKLHSGDWEKWHEVLPSGKVLSVYRHPEGYRYKPNFDMMQGGWVIVYPSHEERYGFETEKHCLPRGTDMLTITCLMHEMRRKYGGSDD